MTDDKQRLQNLEQLHESLTFALEDVKKEIDHITLRLKNSHSGAMSDSFSENKEKFLAP